MKNKQLHKRTNKYKIMGKLKLFTKNPYPKYFRTASSYTHNG